MADSTVVTGDRGVFGLTPATAAPASPLRVQGAPARAAAAPVVSLDANGDLRVGALVAADIPAAFTRRDVAETITESWTWAAGKLVTFAAGSLAPPAASARSIGTRLVLEPVAASTEFAIGRETAGLWTSVPVGSEHRWYVGTVARLRIATDGTVRAEGGTGFVYGVSAADGSGGFATNGNLNLFAGATGAIYLQSGTAGSSGLIAPFAPYREALGALNRKYLSLHAAELWVETLVAQNTLATIGGRILVGSTTTLTRDVASGDTTIYVKHNSLKLGIVGIEFGSKVFLEAAGKFEGMIVTSTAPPTATAQGDYPYTVLRAQAGSAWAWFAGDAVFDTGQAASPAGSFIDLYSLTGLTPGSTAGPTIVGNVRLGDAPLAYAERWAIGNLRGIYNNGTTHVYGAAFGPADGMHVQIDATNGIRMLGAGNAFVYGSWDMDANVSIGNSTGGELQYRSVDGSLRLKFTGVDKLVATADGTLSLAAGLVAGAFAGTTGTVRSAGATAYNAGSGFWFSAVNGGATTALIGNSASRRIQWDGSSLKVVSDGLTIDENGITLQQGSSYAASRGVQWGAFGLRLWDSSSANAGQIFRPGGDITVTANAGSLILQGGGSGIDRTTLTIAPSFMSLAGVSGAGVRPAFYPAETNVSDLGKVDLQWRNLYVGNVIYNLAMATWSWIGIGNPANQGSFQLALSADSAYKPGTATWNNVSDVRAKRDVEAVDPDAALGLVRRVPIKSWTFTGDHGTAADAPGIGPVADEIRAVLPRSVSIVGPDHVLTFNAHELFMLNVAAVQALAARLDALEGKGSV